MFAHTVLLLIESAVCDLPRLLERIASFSADLIERDLQVATECDQKSQGVSVLAFVLRESVNEMFKFLPSRHVRLSLPATFWDQFLGLLAREFDQAPSGVCFGKLADVSHKVAVDCAGFAGHVGARPTLKTLE
jgi:hypothetical protein